MLVYIICGILILGIIAQMLSSLIGNKDNKKFSLSFVVRQALAIIAVLCFGVVSSYCLNMLTNIDGFSDLSFLKKIWRVLIFLSPYGREAVKQTHFRYPLNVASVCTGLIFIAMITQAFSDSRKEIFSGMVLAFTLSMISWYICFASCYLIALIPVFYNVLAFIVALLVSCGLGLFSIGAMTAWENEEI